MFLNVYHIDTIINSLTDEGDRTLNIFTAWAQRGTSTTLLEQTSQLGKILKTLTLIMFFPKG